MITVNHSSSQYSGCCHFGRFDCDAKAYAADADTENSNYFNKEEQIYHTVSNDNNSKKSENEENNSAINFALSESSQCVHEC